MIEFTLDPITGAATGRGAPANLGPSRIPHLSWQTRRSLSFACRRRLQPPVLAPSAVRGGPEVRVRDPLCPAISRKRSLPAFDEQSSPAATPATSRYSE